MRKRLAIVWAALKGDLRLLWFAVLQPQSPAWLKLGIAAGVLYLVMPIDLIPDVIPALGAILIAAALGLIDIPALRAIWRISRIEFVFAMIALVAPITLGVLIKPGQVFDTRDHAPE